MTVSGDSGRVECYFAFDPTIDPPAPWTRTDHGTLIADLSDIQPNTDTNPAAPALAIAGITPDREILILNLHGLAHLGLHGPNRQAVARSLVYQLLLTPTTTITAADATLIPAINPRARVHDATIGPLPATVTFVHGNTPALPGTVTINTDPASELDNTLFTPANRSGELFCGPHRFEIWRTLDLPAPTWEQLTEEIDPTPEPQPVDEILPDHLWVSVLGPIAITHPTDPDRSLGATTGKNTPNRYTELLARMALSPGGQVTSEEAIDTLWPGESYDKRRRPLLEALSRLRRELGDIPGSDDRIILTRDDTTRSTGRDSAAIRINPAITCDWLVFRDLIPTTPTAAPTANLKAAVDLIRGAPLQDAPDGRWAWAKYILDEAIDLLADTALELAQRLVIDNDTPSAYASCRAGLAVNPQRQDLWQLTLSISPPEDHPELIATLRRSIPSNEITRSTKSLIERATAA